MENLYKLRQEYKKGSLDERSSLANPLAQFKKWFEELVQSKPYEPNAMVLASANSAGAPSMRVVLLKGLSTKGFIFFTNYLSRKGRQFKNNNNASLLFYWPELERQVRVEGKVKLLNALESDKYFAMRPRLAQIGAHASRQSSRVKSRQQLEEDFLRYQLKFSDQVIPRPAEWGGYLLVPNYYEFWQGRENRFHDRICYKKVRDSWQKGRLAP